MPSYAVSRTRRWTKAQLSPSEDGETSGRTKRERSRPVSAASIVPTVPPSHSAATAIRVKTWPTTAPRSTTPFEVAGSPSRRARNRASSVAGTGHSSVRRDPRGAGVVRVAEVLPRGDELLDEERITLCRPSDPIDECLSPRCLREGVVRRARRRLQSGSGSRKIGASPIRTRRQIERLRELPAVPRGRPRSARPGPGRRDARRTGPTSHRPTGHRR